MYISHINLFMQTEGHHYRFLTIQETLTIRDAYSNARTINVPRKNIFCSNSLEVLTQPSLLITITYYSTRQTHNKVSLSKYH